MTSSTAKGQLSRLAVRSGSTIATAARSLSFHWPDTTSSRLDSQWRCEDGGGGRRRAAMSVLLRVALRLRFGSRWFPFSLVLPFLSPLLSFAGALLLLLRLQRRLLRKADDVVHVVLRRDGVRTRRRRVDACTEQSNQSHSLRSSQLGIQLLWQRQSNRKKTDHTIKLNGTPCCYGQISLPEPFTKLHPRATHVNDAPIQSSRRI